MKISELEYFELKVKDHPILGGFVFTNAQALAGPGIATANGKADAFGQHTDTSVKGFTDVDQFFSEARARAEARARDRFYSGHSVYDAFAIYGFIG
ncbi:MAG: hypothetical protein F6J94_30160 [Moorea sp. SIO1F2]|uniref:hypothetical protein n=1 Tax=unclassified Moorena TaxID=2683338 RepID=UPI0013B9ADC6|nr:MULTISPECIES: hypothetical protein [unclassified Moorena]NEO20169.1 hypothetical protein [Moorena sp. SIO4A5]NEP23787.1 hypothetical protein [Moorena sp. SIO3I6]NEQ59383.1 hypothetical protein [Moorena sp. SIO4A1]NET85994.1 hypothetical protein [Moorena sp. SIO1F2]